MKLPSAIEYFLELKITLENLCLPYFYAKTEYFEQFQLGYRVNAITGEDLTGTREGDFNENWYVVCSNYFNDPFFVDFTEESTGFPVYYSQHGSGKWIPIKIADTLENFIYILTNLKEFEDDQKTTLKYLSNAVYINNEFWSEVYSSTEENEDYL